MNKFELLDRNIEITTHSLNFLINQKKLVDKLEFITEGDVKILLGDIMSGKHDKIRVYADEVGFVPRNYDREVKGIRWRVECNCMLKPEAMSIISDAILAISIPPGQDREHLRVQSKRDIEIDFCWYVLIDGEKRFI